MARRMGSGLMVDEWTDLSRRCNNDVNVTDVMTTAQKMTRIVDD